ncbi:MAG: acyl-CoA synthetase [Rhodospirillaceae bacterium]
MEQLLPERFNIAKYCLSYNARYQPGKTALIIVGDCGRERRWNYYELDLAIRRLAGGLLAHGARPAERIMIRMDNDLPYLLAFFGGLAAGLVSVPASAALTGEEADFLRDDSEASWVAQSGDLAFHRPLPASVRGLDAALVLSLAANGPEIDYADTAPGDPAYLIYTSGTTGRPKGVLHAHRSAWGRRPMYQGWYGIGPDDVMLHAGAFNWTYTLGVGLIDPWANGATAILYNGTPDPAIWPELIARYGVTLFATVPSLYRRILKYGDISAANLATLRHGLTAGEALSPALLAAWRKRTGKELFEALGMSEISTYISTHAGMTTRPGSPGKPQPGRHIAILNPITGSELPAGETGLLAIHRSDPGLMLGYWKRPEEEELVYRGEWFAGGDLAHLDADGYIWFHGRNDDILNTQGYRLSPLEIEHVLSLHPEIADVAVAEVAVSDEVSILTAYVVPHAITSEASSEAASKTSILEWASDHLAAYKRPRQVIFLAKLPRTANGKLLRRELINIL